MKKKDLLKLKSLIMAGVMATSLSACSVEPTSSEATSEVDSEISSEVVESENNYSVVLIENNKAIVFEAVAIDRTNYRSNELYLYLDNKQKPNITIHSENVFLFYDENHYEEALKFANFYCDDVIVYDDLMNQSLEDIQGQKLNLSK